MFVFDILMVFYQIFNDKYISNTILLVITEYELNLVLKVRIDVGAMLRMKTKLYQYPTILLRIKVFNTLISHYTLLHQIKRKPINDIEYQKNNWKCDQNCDIHCTSFVLFHRRCSFSKCFNFHL